MTDPWYKTSLQLNLSGMHLSLQVPHDVFSTQRIDEGTLLLLQHLPSHKPLRILDMGCGYGALGLPVATQYPGAQVEMVDRDLLAVRYSNLNASKNGILNVEAYGSLGFREVEARNHAYDWILCNVPARIGLPFIVEFMERACEKLSPEGEVRVVVIRDLGPVFEDLALARKWNLTECARGPRHTVYSMTKSSGSYQVLTDAELYCRDEVLLPPLTLLRPFDWGGDDPKRLHSGLPLLFESFPRQSSPKNILVFRSGYGQVTLTCALRWREATVVAIDRDLLATTFTSLNAGKHSVAERIDLRESEHFPAALNEKETFDLIAGEISSSAGLEVAISEITAVGRHLSPSGQASLLCLEKIEKEWLKNMVRETGLRIHALMKRDGYVVLSISK